MIIRPDGLLITQPDHAALAARMMRDWRREGLPDSPRRDVILLAIERHDHGWLSLDASPLLDDESGEILDFISAPEEVKRRVWPEAVAQLQATPYAAALVAQHAVHIYRRYRSDSSWQAFFDEMEALRNRHLLQAQLQPKDLDADYAFLRIGDLMSLTFCNAWTDVQKDDFGSNYAFRLDGDRLTVTPDPFEGREIPFEIAGRALRQAGFTSSSEAHAALVAAPSVLLNGVAVGASA